MRIAILGSRGFPSSYGGYETLVRYVARAWALEGHEVSVYCRTHGEHERRWTVDGVRCLWTPGWNSTNWSTLTYGATSHAHAALQSYDAALVLNIANGYFLPLLRAVKTPVAVNTDGIEWERGKWGRSARTVFQIGARMCARYADVLVADSNAVADVWAERFAVKSVFIPYGAPVLSAVPDDRVRALGLVRHTYALAVARLIPENNVELFLDAVERAGVGGRAVVVGSNPSNPTLEGRLEQLSRDGVLRWLGHVNDQELLDQLWANCGVYVHGHSVGGTNPALLQALGAGAPTLALQTPFNAEVLLDSVHLYEKDAEQLGVRMREVLDDLQLQDTLRGAGQRVVSERYQWPDIAERYLEALQLARRRRSGACE